MNEDSSVVITAEEAVPIDHLDKDVRLSVSFLLMINLKVFISINSN